MTETTVTKMHDVDEARNIAFEEHGRWGVAINILSHST
jgi:hypothetical protein